MNAINVYMHEHRLPSIMWVGLIQSAEGLNRTKRLASLSKRKFSNRLSLGFMCTVLSPGSRACRPILQVLDMPTSIRKATPSVQFSSVAQSQGFLLALVVKNPPANAGDLRDMGSIPGSGRSLQEAMATNSSILPWGSHGQRSLAGYSPQQHKGLDTHAHNANMKITFFRSVAQSCPTLCNPMGCSTPGLPVHHQLPECAQTHVH